jgi:hypothetical protein
MARRGAVNKRLPYCDMRKLALLTREKIGQKGLLTETDQLLRNSHDLNSRMGHAKKDAARLNSKARSCRVT